MHARHTKRRSKYPVWTPGHGELVRVFLQMGKKEEANQWFRNALALDPRMVRQYSDLAASLGAAK